MQKIYLGPSVNAKQNIYMYCNYARANSHEERCLVCERDCEHRGKHTVLEK